jgi:hypothetical protein
LTSRLLAFRTLMQADTFTCDVRFSFDTGYKVVAGRLESTSGWTNMSARKVIAITSAGGREIAGSGRDRWLSDAGSLVTGRTIVIRSQKA